MCICKWQKILRFRLFCFYLHIYVFQWKSASFEFLTQVMFQYLHIVVTNQLVILQQLIHIFPHILTKWTKVSVSIYLHLKIFIIFTLHYISESTEKKPDVKNVELKRELGLFSAVNLVINITIGAGIFVSPAIVYRFTGSVALCLIMWVVAGVMSLIGTIIYFNITLNAINVQF